MKRTAIYIRVSSQAQAQEGDSIPAQRKGLRTYIDEHDDLVFVDEYLDDGVSGTRSDRDELQRLLCDVSEGKIDLILVTKLDRLYRSIRHYLNLQDALDKAGVNWIAIWEPIYDTSTPQGRLIINQMMSIAQFEAEQTGQRIRQVQEYKVSKGEVISGSTPTGLQIVDKHLVPDENAPLVKEAFEFYSFHGNLSATMRLTAHNPRFPRTQAAYKNMLRNTKYIGLFRGNDHFCEPIVDADLFWDVQRKLQMNIKKSQKHDYIFSGLLRCAECGCVLAANTRHKRYPRKTTEDKIEIVKLYRCPKRYNGGIRRCSNTKVCTEHVLERYLLDHIRPMVKDLVYTVDIQQSQVKDNRHKISVKKKRMERLRDLYLDGLMSLDEYKLEREAITAEIAKLSSESPAEPTDVDGLRKLLSSDFETLYAGLTASERQFFWRSIIKEIRFGLDRKYTVIFL